MPDRTYVPRQPPTPLDRVLHHPYEITIAAWWVICGAVLAVSLVWPELPTSPSIQGLPMWLALVLPGLIGTGGAAILVGLLIPWERLDTAWLIERLGLSAAGVGWLSFGTTALLLYPHSLVSWSLGLTMSAAALLRFVATIVVEHRTRAAITGGAV